MKNLLKLSGLDPAGDLSQPELIAWLMKMGDSYEEAAMGSAEVTPGGARFAVSGLVTFWRELASSSDPEMFSRLETLEKELGGYIAGAATPAPAVRSEHSATPSSKGTGLHGQFLQIDYTSLEGGVVPILPCSAADLKNRRASLRSVSLRSRHFDGGAESPMVVFDLRSKVPGGSSGLVSEEEQMTTADRRVVGDLEGSEGDGDDPDSDDDEELLSGSVGGRTGRAHATRVRTHRCEACVPEEELL